MIELLLVLNYLIYRSIYHGLMVRINEAVLIGLFTLIGSCMIVKLEDRNFFRMRNALIGLFIVLFIMMVVMSAVIYYTFDLSDPIDKPTLRDSGHAILHT
ncbi:hypothetical protein DFQ01_115100 [Paenibacillus cellulosilyticus]|uniref:Uncharacterized protein n=1 Tax=Paenibacillus cellulosilyticus TaxID=375489 RepID=A0A2V2YZN3_9BACL|nr:hypothetical protein DFQ01_115100 [Paenibacillus cellulosilyticus]